MTRIRQGAAEHLNLKRNLRSQMTGPEIKLWARLRSKQFRSLKFRRQHGIGPYVVDFYCPERKLVVEIDGDTHADLPEVVKDQHRAAYLQSLGLRVIRYTNSDVMSNLEGVLQDLERATGDSASP